METQIEKPLRKGEAISRNPGWKPDSDNLLENALICNSDPEHVGRVAANQFLANGGSEVDLLERLSDHLNNSNDRVAFFRAYFLQKERLGV